MPTENVLQALLQEQRTIIAKNETDIDVLRAMHVIPFLEYCLDNDIPDIAEVRAMVAYLLASVD